MVAELDVENEVLRGTVPCKVSGLCKCKGYSDYSRKNNVGGGPDF
jgi:hypothetical protein